MSEHLYSLACGQGYFFLGRFTAGLGAEVLLAPDVGLVEVVVLVFVVVIGVEGVVVVAEVGSCSVFEVAIGGGLVCSGGREDIILLEFESG